MGVDDILNLYCVSRDFHNSIRTYLLSSINTWIRYRAPEAGLMFPFKIYASKLVPDPEERTLGRHYPGKGAPGKPLPENRQNEIRVVPGLKYLQMVLVRDRCCREMVAILARNGHRLPQSSIHGTLLRLWVLTDLPTSAARRAVLRSEDMWPDVDVYNAQLLFVKLTLHFNDPVFGPGTTDLLRLILGQKGLYPLWQLLMKRKYVTVRDILALKTRYDGNVPPDTRPEDRRHKPRFVHDVPVAEVGLTHLEGWGTYSSHHLLRPDELIPLEAIERGLNLRSHLRRMVEWGHVDHRTGENLVPTEEEMYLSDEERVLANVDTTLHWKKKHVQKKRWDTLTPTEQQDIKDEDEDERLRLLAWAGTVSDDDDSEHDSETYDLNDEIDRGFILPEPSLLPDTSRQVPAIDDEEGWMKYVNKFILTAPDLDMCKDEELRHQSLREEVNAKRQENKENLKTWHKWLRSPEMAERIRAGLQIAARDADEAEAARAAEAELNDLIDMDQDGDYDGDVEMGES